MSNDGNLRPLVLPVYPNSRNPKDQWPIGTRPRFGDSDYHPHPTDPHPYPVIYVPVDERKACTHQAERSGLEVAGQVSLVREAGPGPNL